VSHQAGATSLLVLVTQSNKEAMLLKVAKVKDQRVEGKKLPCGLDDSNIDF